MATQSTRLAVLTAATTTVLLALAGPASAAGKGHGHGQTSGSGTSTHHASSSHGKRTAPGQVKHRTSSAPAVQRTPSPAPVVAAPSAATAPTTERRVTSVVRHSAPAAPIASPASVPVTVSQPHAVIRTVDVVSEHPTTRSLGNLPAAAKALEKSISIPLGMFAVLFLFLFLQNRIDRHDPKIRVTEASSLDTLPFHLPRTTRHVPLRPIPVRRVPLTAPAPTSIRLSH